VAAEATWVSLLIDAAVNTSAGPHVDLPFLAFALPAVAATAVTGGMSRLGWRPARLIPALTPLVILGTALTAGILTALTTPGDWWIAATQPWTIPGHTAAVTAGLAWCVAVLSWGRGLWLGLAPPSLRHLAWSLGLGGAAFLGIFAARADSHDVTFRHATEPAGWLLFVFFPFVSTAVALVHERDLEDRVLHHTGSRPSGVWIAVLAVPMLAVALVALLIAAAAGPAGRDTARGVAVAAEAIGKGTATAARWLWDLLPRAHHDPVRPPPAPPGVVHGAPARPSGATSSLIPVVVWEILAVAVVGALVVAAVRYLRHRHTFPAWRTPRPPGEAAEVEKDFIFTWRHLVAQLWHALLLVLGRLRHRPSAPVTMPGLPVVTLDDREYQTVRQAYRRVLSAAQEAGRGRKRTETTRELQGRLAADLGPAARDALGGLTDIYDRVRYGGDDPGPEVHERAVAYSAVLATAMETAPPD
jgi:hypothetical protein